MGRLKAILIIILGLTAASYRPAALSPSSTSDLYSNGKVNWMTWEEAMERNQQEKRKIILDVYTDWCGWCKRMEQNTFQQPDIARYLNDNFYPVKLDAEYKGELEYRGKVYKYVKNGQRGYHELAAELLRGRLSFPTVVFLDENQNIIQSIVGYKTPQQFEQIASYFASDQYKVTPWSVYQQNYKSMISE